MAEVKKSVEVPPNTVNATNKMVIDNQFEVVNAPKGNISSNANIGQRWDAIKGCLVPDNIQAAQAEKSNGDRTWADMVKDQQK